MLYILFKKKLRCNAPYKTSSIDFVMKQVLFEVSMMPLVTLPQSQVNIILYNFSSIVAEKKG